MWFPHAPSFPSCRNDSRDSAIRFYRQAIPAGPRPISPDHTKPRILWISRLKSSANVFRLPLRRCWKSAGTERHGGIHHDRRQEGPVAPDTLVLELRTPSGETWGTIIRLRLGSPG